MTALQVMTVRANAALGRFSALQKRAEKIPASAATVTRSLLKELGEALEHLQVATAQLQREGDELAVTRERALQGQQRFDEFTSVLPLSCLWTSAQGDIEAANPAAAALLNVSLQHIAGRPLMLFTTDRQKFADALKALTDGTSNAVEITVVLRPRERRPRAVRMTGRRLEHDARSCWFLQEQGELIA